jgi:transmembrane sensor
MIEEKNKIIKTLTNKYLNNDLPEEVQIEFQAWMLNSRNREEKDNVLNEYLDSLNPEVDYKQFKNKLEKLHTRIDTEKKVRDISVLVKFGYFAAAACLLAGVLIIASVTLRKTLVSPETMVYVTSQANKGAFTLPDGSTVILNSSSRLEVPSNFGKKARGVKLDGEAYFDVAKDSLHPFQILSRMATVRVLGTAFNMKAYSSDNYAEVVLERGLLEISGRNLAEPIVMSPNEKLTIEKTTQLEKVDASNYISWIGRTLFIDNMALGDILINIEHRFNVEFIQIGKVDLSSHLTFVIRDESIESILNKISLVTSFKYYIRGDTIFYSTK